MVWLELDLPNFPENGNVGKWKMNFMDFPENSGKKSKKEILLKVSLFYFSFNIFGIFLVTMFEANEKFLSL